MNKKDYLEKTKKLARITRIICRISIVASIVALAVLIVTNIVAFVVPADHLKPLQDPGKLGIFTGGIYVPADVFTSLDALRKFLMEVTARMSVGIVVFIFVALHVTGLLRSVENGTPFEVENVVRLRKIGVILLIGSVLVPTVSSFVSIYSQSQSLLEVKSNSMIDVTLLLCGFLIFILSGIFAYGARLQREHDETV